MKWALPLFFSFLMLFAVCFSGCADEDSGSGDTDTDTDSDTDGDTDTGTGCEDMEWGNPDYYLVNGGTVARWQQTAWVDANDNGQIDDDEKVDAEIDFLELCESEKTSLVLLLATDD